MRELKDLKIDSIEKTIWRLILLAVVVILYLTLSLLELQFFGFLGESEAFLLPNNAYQLSIFLSILIFLFCAYIIIHQRKVLLLNRALLDEKKAANRLTQNVETMGALFEVSSSINTQKKLSDILNTITREMLTCFNADHSSIMLLDKGSKILKTVSSVGKRSEFVKDAMIPLGESIAGRVIESGKALLIHG